MLALAQPEPASGGLTNGPPAGLPIDELESKLRSVRPTAWTRSCGEAGDINASRSLGEQSNHGTLLIQEACIIPVTVDFPAQRPVARQVSNLASPSSYALTAT